MPPPPSQPPTVTSPPSQSLDDLWRASVVRSATPAEIRRALKRVRLLLLPPSPRL